MSKDNPNFRRRTDEELNVIFNNNLRNIRSNRKVRQEDLAKGVGVSRQTIISIEKGKYRPSLVLALLMAKYFDVKVEDIFSIDETESTLNAEN